MCWNIWYSFDIRKYFHHEISTGWSFTRRYLLVAWWRDSSILAPNQSCEFNWQEKLISLPTLVHPIFFCAIGYYWNLKLFSHHICYRTSKQVEKLFVCKNTNLGSSDFDPVNAAEDLLDYFDNVDTNRIRQVKILTNPVTVNLDVELKSFNLSLALVESLFPQTSGIATATLTAILRDPLATIGAVAVEAVAATIATPEVEVVSKVLLAKTKGNFATLP